jgi:predicted DsbA family dithiol-disulfide isomerase
VGVPLDVEVWGDLVCPFCFLGLVQLQRAIELSALASDVTITPRAFELDRHAAASHERPLAELVARKYDLSVDSAHAFHARLEREASQLGMTWSLASAQPSNTFDAHRLVALAGTQGRALAATERLLAAYFSEGQRLSDRDTLVTLGHELGLTDVEASLTTDAYSADVRDDEDRALELGVTGVPATLIDGRFWVSGAQGVDAYASALHRAARRREVTG